MRIGIFDNQHEAVKELPEERQGAFWVAFFAYVFDEVEPEFSEPMERMAWNLVKPYIEKSRTAGQNGKKGGRKPKSETKSKTRNETKTENQKSNQDGKQNLKPSLSESEREREREGLGESLKDSLNPSLRVAHAGGEDPAPRHATKADADMSEQRRIMAEAEAAAVPCPASVAELVRGIA